MMEFTTKSKLYIAPKKKNHFFLIILNICIIIVAILSLVSIFANGIKVGNISPIIIGLFVVIRSRTWIKTEPHYEFSMAHITINENMCVSYDIGQEVTVYLDSVSSIEYSDRLECLRFVADYFVTTNNATKNYAQHEFLFYIVANNNQELFSILEQRTGLKVNYLDRDFEK